MNKLFVLTLKDLRVLFSDKGNLFWIFAFPALFALFFGTIFSGVDDGPSGMEIALVNDDPSDFAARYIERLSAEEALIILPMQRDEALDRVRRGSLSAAVIINEHFSAGFGLFSDTPAMEMAVDPSRRMEIQFLKGLLVKAKFETLAAWFTDTSRLRARADAWRGDIVDSTTLDETLKDPLLALIDAGTGLLDRAEELTFDGDLMNVATVDVGSRRQASFTAFQLTFPQAVIWGIMGCSATFAISIVQERQKGTYERLRLAPVGRAHILGGKGLACGVTCVVVVGFLFVGAKLLFRMPLRSVPLFLLAAGCVIVCFVGLMMFISTLGRTEQSASGAGWAILLVAAMLGGGMVPLIFMPAWLKTVSHVSPVKWSILALEGGIWRNLSLGEMAGPLVILLTIGTAAFALGVTRLIKND